MEIPLTATYKISLMLEICQIFYKICYYTETIE